MNEIKIEKDVELPKSERGADSIYPFEDMKIGDSFFVKGDKKKAGNVRGCKQWAQNKNNAVFTSRFREENQNGETVEGVRVWRIE